MPEPELTIRDHTPPMPVTLCETGRHIAHPGDTCDEITQLQAAFRAYFEQAYAAAFAEADRLCITGNGTGEPLGFLGPASREPTPAERALAILQPHLGAIALYRPTP